jgi:hypothetical protein
MVEVRYTWTDLLGTQLPPSTHVEGASMGGSKLSVQAKAFSSLSHSARLVLLTEWMLEISHRHASELVILSFAASLFQTTHPFFFPFHRHQVSIELD